MVDLRKEIKLSDLVRRSKTRKPSSAKARKAAPRSTKKQELVGLKVGASQLAAARVQNEGGRSTLLPLARRPIPPGIVVGGEVRDVAALGQALDEFFTEHKLPRRNVRLGIGTNRIGVRMLELEGIEDERLLGNAIRFRAHETLAIPMDQAILDYHVVSENIDESGSVSRKVVLAAAYKEPIDHFVTACQLAKIELSGIDLEAFALLRAVTTRASRNGSGPVAVVALTLGHDRSTLAISDGDVCDFTRVLDWGGGTLDAAIERDLGLTSDEAAEIKLQSSLEADAVAEASSEMARARTAIGREVTNLARDLVSSLQFYQSQPGSLPIAEILVTGGTSRLPGLVDELRRLSRANVKLAEPLSSLSAPGGMGDRDDLASLTVAIGLGIDR